MRVPVRNHAAQATTRPPSSVMAYQTTTAPVVARQLFTGNTCGYVSGNPSESSKSTRSPCDLLGACRFSLDLSLWKRVYDWLRRQHQVL